MKTSFPKTIHLVVAALCVSLMLCACGGGGSSAAPALSATPTGTVSLDVTDAPSMEQPNRIRPIESSLPYARNLTIEMPPGSVRVIEIVAN